MVTIAAAFSFVLALPITVNGFAHFPIDPKGPLEKWHINYTAPWDITITQYRKPRVSVPFNADALSSTELDSFVAAAQLISAATDNCIGFEQRSSASIILGDPNATVILQNRENGRPLDMCRTFAGKYKGSSRQTMFVGQNNNPQLGCLNSGDTDRETVRILMNLLGVANEYQRSDRTHVLDINTNYRNLIADALILENSLTPLFDEIRSLETLLGFDVLSATMVSPTRFSQDKKSPFFDYKNPSKRVPAIAYISKNDCLGLKSMYSCNSKCNISDYGFGTVTPNSLDSDALVCWKKSEPTSISLLTGLNFSPKLGGSLFITSPSRTYLSLDSPTLDPELKLIQTLTSAQKFDMVIVDQSPTKSWEYEITVNVRCRPLPTNPSEYLVSGGKPHSLTCKEEDYGISGTAPHCTDESTVTIKINGCKTANTIPVDFSFQPFPLNPKMVLQIRSIQTPTWETLLIDKSISPPAAPPAMAASWSFIEKTGTFKTTSAIPLSSIVPGYSVQLNYLDVETNIEAAIKINTLLFTCA